jgi:hypothetical protein
MSDDALVLTIPRTKDAPREARAQVRALAGPRAPGGGERILYVTEPTSVAAERATGDPLGWGYEERDALRGYLDAYGIGTGVHYPVPIHRTGAYASAGLGRGSLPVAESLADRVLSLPMHPSLTAEEIERIATAVHSFEPLAQAA